MSLDDFIRKADQNASILDDEGMTLKVQQITSNDREQIKLVATLLEPFEAATKVMCQNDVPTISMMMPFFDSILDVLQQNQEKYRQLAS